MTERNIGDVIRDMTDHGKENPTHGVNCACKDKWIREARVMMSEPHPTEDRYTPKGWRANRDYILSVLLRDRY